MPEETVDILLKIPKSVVPDLVIAFGRDLMDAEDPALRDAATRAANMQPTTGAEQMAIAVAWFSRLGYDKVLDVRAQKASAAVRANPGIPWQRP